MQKPIVIICGKVFDGIHEELTGPIEILVEGNRITQMSSSVSRSDDALIIDLSDATVTPGMIDAHMHMDFFDWRQLYQNLGRESEEWQTLAILHTAQRTLERGFTMVRVMGGLMLNGYGVSDVKKAINAGYFTGSRLYITNHLLGVPGGHGDFSQCFKSNPTASNDAVRRNPGLGTGADFFRNAVRNEVKYGSDFIKIILSGGFATPDDLPDEQQLSDEELKAIFDTANALNRPSTAHVYSSDLIKKLIDFRIPCIEHGALMDEATARLMEESGTYLVPTMSCYEEVITLDEENLAKKTPEYQAKLRKYSEVLQESRKTIVNSKIKLGYGTDFIVVYQNYESWREYATMLKSGIDPFRALKAATSVNAEILNQPDLGVLAVGKLADIAAWKRDLLNDPEALSECAFVMKDGKIYNTVGGQQNSNKVIDYAG